MIILISGINFLYHSHALHTWISSVIMTHLSCILFQNIRNHPLINLFALIWMYRDCSKINRQEKPSLPRTKFSPYSNPPYSVHLGHCNRNTMNWWLINNQHIPHSSGGWLVHDQGTVVRASVLVYKWLSFPFPWGKEWVSSVGSLLQRH